jgi:fatty acid desaturase
MKADSIRSAACIAREYACLAPAISLGAWGIHLHAEQQLSLWAFIACSLLLIATIAALQHRLSALAHEASHYVLFRNALANELASDLLLLFPLFAVTQKYRQSHFGHHRHVNDPARDPDWQRLALFEPMNFPMPKARFVLRFVARGLWPPAILGYLLGRAKAANHSRQSTTGRPLRAPYRFRVARTMRGAYWLAGLTFLHALNLWPAFWLFWIVPLLTFYPFFMLMREIAHHANAPDSRKLTNSRLFDVNPLLAWAVFPYGQHAHLLHHLFAMIPHHKMREAHQFLCDWPPYRDQVLTCRGYFFRKRGTGGPSLLDVLANPPLAQSSVN